MAELGSYPGLGAPGAPLCHCGLGRIAQLHRVSVSLSAKWEEPESPPHRAGVRVRGDDACRMLRAGARLLESVPGTRRRELRGGLLRKGALGKGNDSRV